MVTLGYMEAVLYGLIQGVTEFLPISSSGHLRLAHLMGLGAIPPELELPFDVLLHAATLLAIVCAFARELLVALRPRPGLWGALLVGMVPAGLAGLLAREIYIGAGRSLWLIGVFYCLTAVLLVVSERVSMRRCPLGDAQASEADCADDLRALRVRQGVWVGVLQLLAPFPGVSRSGSAIAGGLLGDMTPNTAVAFSFLVGVPLIAAAAAKDVLDGNFAVLVSTLGWGPMIAAFAASLFSGLAAIAALRYVVRRRGLRWFGLYCLVLGCVCILTGALR
ncbi:MAG: undecaprenyl-diphosphate phosphatase [Planctomycetota bacterium]